MCTIFLLKKNELPLQREIYNPAFKVNFQRACRQGEVDQQLDHGVEYNPVFRLAVQQDRDQVLLNYLQYFNYVNMYIKVFYHKNTFVELFHYFAIIYNKYIIIYRVKFSCL